MAPIAFTSWSKSLHVLARNYTTIANVLAELSQCSGCHQPILAELTHLLDDGTESANTNSCWLSSANTLGPSQPIYWLISANVLADSQPMYWLSGHADGTQGTCKRFDEKRLQGRGVSSYSLKGSKTRPMIGSIFFR